MLSIHQDPRFLSTISQDAMAGWCYWLKKSVTDVNALRCAIVGSVMGLVVLDPQLVANVQPREGGALSRLTPRQYEILGLMARGYSNAAIAEHLGLSLKSVENQINVIYQHIGVGGPNAAIHPRVAAVLAFLRETYPKP